MRKEVVLITGANGEIGHGLITFLAEQNNVNVIALDVQPLDDELKPYCMRFIQGDILDGMLLGRLVVEYEIRTIYHLASILSTKAEYNPRPRTASTWKNAQPAAAGRRAVAVAGAPGQVRLPQLDRCLRAAQPGG